MSQNEHRGDILIIGLWERGTYCISNVRVTYTDPPKYQMKDSSKILQAAEHLKKKKYLQPCHDQRHHFTPVIVSVDSLIGKEHNTVLRVLAARTAIKTR
jgi:hypothetical protein